MRRGGTLGRDRTTPTRANIAERQLRGFDMDQVATLSPGIPASTLIPD
jgi:hypothetical protein